MSKPQYVATALSAAGLGVHPGVDGTELLYVEGTSLISKLLKDETIGDQTLVASSVRPNSNAAYYLTPTTRIVFYVSTSSELKAVQYDNEEEEWVPVDSFPVLKVASSGQAAATADKDGNPAVFYEDGSGHLVYLDNAWNPTVLPTDAILSGTPLRAVLEQSVLNLYYVTAKDGAVHFVQADASGKQWTDNALAQVKFTDSVSAFVVNPDPKSNGSYSVLAVTTSKKLLHYSTVDSKKEGLGYISSDGKFVSQTSAENVNIGIFIFNF